MDSSNLVTTLWSMEAAGALLLAAFFAVAWAVDRRNLAQLALCLVSIAMVGLVRTEVGMMHAATVLEYVEWARLSYLPLFFIIVGLVLFVHLWLGPGSRWLLATIVLARLIVLVGNFLTRPTFGWRELVALRRITFLGESIAVPGQIVVRSWQWLAAASCLLAIALVVQVTLRAWRRRSADDRRKSLIVAAGVGLPFLTSVLFTQAVLLGFAQLPLLITPFFLITLLVVAFELSRGLALSRQTLQELEESHSKLARINRVTALGQLASALAHELTQPLAAILRNAEAGELNLSGTSPNLKELQAILEDIRKDDRRATDVIDKMRALLQRRTIRMQSLALGELLEDAISLLRPEAMMRQVALNCTVEPGLPLVLGDRVHLSQVLVNLIINGMDAVQTSECRAKDVAIGARPDEAGGVEVSVTDSATAVRPEVIDKMFEPFYTTKSGGLGMGLSISRTIIEAHGGRLWVEQTRYGGGLTFRFTLSRVHAAVS